MKIAIGLHAAAVARAPLGLHPGDRRALALALGLAATATTGDEVEVIVVEALGTPGVSPNAISTALDRGAARAIRVVDAALAGADAHTAGLVLGAVMGHLDPDLILFAGDADPEGLADVPATMACRLAAPYLTDVVALELAVEDRGGDSSGAPDAAPRRAEAVIESGPWRVRVRVPRGAVLGVGGGAASSALGARIPEDARPSPRIQILTLADLAIDPTLVRRRNDLRGVVEPAQRPLITTSAAESLALLLR